MVDVFASQETEVEQLAESLPVIVLVGRPFGVDLPEHPLRAHLVDAAAETVPHAVAGNLNLERVTDFVGDAIEFLVLHTVRGNP